MGYPTISECLACGGLRPRFSADTLRAVKSPQNQQINQNTQPTRPMRVFNRWDIIAEGWYIAVPSQSLRPGQATSMDLCGQRVAIFRGDDGQVRALDAFCPHMGTDLGIGKVEGNSIRCFFHHWRFDGGGKCTDIPCQKAIPAGAKLQSYATAEKYGFIWVYPAAVAGAPLADFSGLEGRELRALAGKGYERSCHHHVTMINGIDPQHLKTVHKIDIEMHVDQAESHEGRWIDLSLHGKIPGEGWWSRLAKRCFGPDYGYTMRYDHASVGLLTLAERLNWKGRALPRLHMIFAYRPIADGRTWVQPIYITPKRFGAFAPLMEWFLLFLTRRAFFALQGEDGRIYENMRFYPGQLLAIDAPVGNFIRYVNRLRASVWSTRKSEPVSGFPNEAISSLPKLADSEPSMECFH